MTNINDCEVLQEEPLALSGCQSNSDSIIEANDMGSLLEQFMEFEKGSDIDLNSYPNSEFITPCGSPSESDDQQTVLGRLMIVQEKLSQSVAESPVHTPNSSQKDDGQFSSSISFAQNKLLRTIDGVHPKGDNIRMADSPKFAKFKRKRAANIPPARRCFSGTTTPRATSPSDIVTPEEKKRREAKLIEALALPFPSVKKGKTPVTVKRNLNEKQKKKFEPIGHIPSRMMPVVSKRRKYTQNKAITNHVNGISDPRRSIEHYCEGSNVNNLADTNIGNTDVGDDVIGEKDDEKAIVDMTIDHEAIAGTILVATTTTSDKKKTESVITTEQADTAIGNKNENFEMSVSIDSNIDENNIINSNGDMLPIATNNNNTGDDTASQEKQNEIKSLIRPLKRKQPKNYRKNNNLEPYDGHDSSQTSSSSSSSSSDDDDEPTYKKRKRKRRYSDNARKSYRRQSRSHRESRSPSPDFGEKKYDDEVYRTASRSPRTDSSGDEHNDGDIKEKLSELSNPVPYDIEHERKVRFLVSEAATGKDERRNIYVGGIKRLTTKTELAERFHRFGHIEKITLHFRQKGDNYAFIIFEEPESAKRAIEEGNDDPKYSPLELCFGGRRKFVGGSYVDFDGNNSYLEEGEFGSKKTRCESPENDFDQLLKMALKSKTIKREPEWT